MSHLTLEYSSNLRETSDIAALCRKLSRFMSAFTIEDRAIFPAGGVRVRAIACDEYCIADGSIADAAFVHAVLKIGSGRNSAAKQATTTGLFDIMKEHFAETYTSRGLALSLELNEFGEAGILKHNNLHERIKLYVNT